MTNYTDPFPNVDRATIDDLDGTELQYESVNNTYSAIAYDGTNGVDKINNALDDAADAQQSGRRDDVELAYYTCQPNKWTFQSKKIRNWVESQLRGRTLNACAGKTKLAHDHEIVRNDINTQIESDCQFDAMDVDEHFEPESFDTVILDPPFSFRKSHDYYEGEKVENLTIVKEKIADLVKPAGHVMTFGYHTRSLGVSRGFKRKEIVLLDHYGGVRATIGVYEQRVEHSLSSYDN